ncbi:Cytosine deaminase [Exophiala xenobiotica]|uniref:Cytosine deaminase n=1 Tax=Lithohypha guttulata TaxID=1690604 RepID=A0ABR0KPB1_9EURO|nr:Cytosine deaminase [Lithohypha guttulata]KAK5330833.1 Cytosine deaminase [Exophiala xenobiotica]
MSTSDAGFRAAVEEAEAGYNEGGVPIGACLVSSDGTILGRGHNMRVQKETLENSGRLPAKAYEGATMYTSLSPCDMCTGACIMYKIGRVVIGENKTYVGGEEYLKQRGVEVVVFNDEKCKGLMEKFMCEKPAVWNEDIGEQ